MLDKRYSFVKSCGTESNVGVELWLWIMWIVGMVVVFGIASHAIGQLEAHNKYIYTVDAMVKQFESGCEKPPEFINVPIKK